MPNDLKRNDSTRVDKEPTPDDQDALSRFSSHYLEMLEDQVNRVGDWQRADEKIYASLTTAILGAALAALALVRGEPTHEMFLGLAGILAFAFVLGVLMTLRQVDTRISSYRWIDKAVKLRKAYLDQSTFAPLKDYFDLPPFAQRKDQIMDPVQLPRLWERGWRRPFFKFLVIGYSLVAAGELMAFVYFLGKGLHWDEAAFFSPWFVAVHLAGDLLG